MTKNHLLFFIIYAAAGIIGMIAFMSGVQNQLVFIGSLFLIMASAVHFKNWKNKRIESIKKGR